MNERGVVRWSRVTAAVAIASIAAIVVVAVAVLSFTSMAPYEGGHLAGTFAVPAAIGGGVYGYLGERGTSLPLRILAFVGVAGGVGALASLPHLTSSFAKHGDADADRAPFILDGNRLRHPTLGFSIAALPPGFVPAVSPAATSAMATIPGPTYAWGNASSKAALILSIGSFDGPDKTFDFALRSMRAGFEDSARAQWGSAAHEVVIKSLASDHDGVFHARWGRIDAQIVLREIVVNGTRRWVSMTAISIGEPQLDDELASFQP